MRLAAPVKVTRFTVSFLEKKITNNRICICDLVMFVSIALLSACV